MQKEVDRPTRLLQFVAFVHLPFSFLFCSPEMLKHVIICLLCTSVFQLTFSENSASNFSENSANKFDYSSCLLPPEFKVFS